MMQNCTCVFQLMCLSICSVITFVYTNWGVSVCTAILSNLCSSILKSYKPSKKISLSLSTLSFIGYCRGYRI